MKNLAIFYGGKSAEHDISIITALQVMNNIDNKQYNIVPIYIHSDNSWHILEKYKEIYSYTQNNLKGKELATGFFHGYLIEKKHFGFKKFIKIDIALNCCHGLNGEDGSLSGLVQLSNIPFVGSNVLASALGMDKVIMKDVFMANNIPCVKYSYFHKEEYEKNKNDIILMAEVNLNYPIIVKPANLGSSIGINISKNREELQKNIKTALSYDSKIILEQVVPNLREINCSVMGNQNNCEASILEEPKNWTNFLDFDEKYIKGNKNNTKKTLNVKLEPVIESTIKELSKKVFSLFGCSGVVRIDFLLNDKTKDFYVNEINTIPGSLANYLWKDKYSFAQLLNKLIDNATAEYLYKNSYTYAYASNVLQNYKNSTKSSKFIKY